MPRDLHSPRYVKLREIIVASRKEARLSQTVVAQRLGRPQSYVADIERNERRVDIVEFLALAEVIGFDAIDALRDVAAVARD